VLRRFSRTPVTTLSSNAARSFTNFRFVRIVPSGHRNAYVWRISSVAINQVSENPLEHRASVAADRHRGFDQLLDDRPGALLCRAALEEHPDVFLVTNGGVIVEDHCGHSGAERHRYFGCPIPNGIASVQYSTGAGNQGTAVRS
jgi:hypothetical protein